MIFKPVEAFIEHNFRAGWGLDFQNVKRGLYKDYYYNLAYVDRDVYGNGTQYTNYGSVLNLNGGTCEGSVDLWGVSLCSTEPTITGTQLNGQWVRTFGLMEKDAPENKADLDVLSYAFYLEDDMKILNSDSIGFLNARLGVRLDGDNYMAKSSLAPRFSLAYITPVKPEFQTQLTFGANRYYARNLFMYKLNEVGSLFTKAYTRETITSPWVAIPYDDGSTSKFKELKIPYSDELMVGVSQEIDVVNLNLKYINRLGKDEIIRQSRPERGYTNNGKSRSDIVSLAVQNTTPIKTANIYHHYLFAFDYTMVNRSYLLGTSYSDDWYDNVEILYNGEVIKYKDRPVENFARPWTLRLNTTHNLQFKQVNLLWNNFFRYRSGYDKMVTLNRTTPGYDATIGSTMTQYGRHHFKGAFSWDMRIGLDFRVDTLLRKESEAGRIYINVDIVNVLNAKNEATLSNNYNYGQIPIGFVNATYGSVAYDVGRQFWIQVGYKY